MKSTFGLALFAAVALASCGSGATTPGAASSTGSSSGGTSGSTSSGGSASVQGTIQGAAFAAQDAAAWTEGDNTVIEIATSPALCSLAGDHAVKAGSRVIDLGFGYGVLGDAGVYEANAGSGVDAQYIQYDATCQPSPADSSGSVTITENTPTTISGSFDLLFGGADRLTGTFTAPVCPAATAAYADAERSAPTCLQ